MNEVEMLCSDDEYIGIYTKLSKKELEYNTYIAEAKEEGIKKEKYDIAKNMLKENIDVNTISRITGLSQEQIGFLQ